MEAFNKKYITNSAQGTKKIGQEFSKKLKPGDFIALFGELGGGKTTFVQGLVRGLGIKRRIISPTFIIFRSYKLKAKKSKVKIESQKSKFFYHIDLYRITDEKDIKGLGLDEIIKEKKDIIVVEWAEKMRDLLPKNRWEISFEYIDDNRRQIAISKLT